MTFEPTRLSKPGDSLENEEASIAILRSRLTSLRPKDEHDDEIEKAVKHAEEVLNAYSAWLSDTSKAFTVTKQDTGLDGVQDIIDEVFLRQRYIENQLTLLSLTDKKPNSHIAKLQRYNELKDVAQELMGLVAENRGVLVGKLYEEKEFGVSADD